MGVVVGFLGGGAEGVEGLRVCEQQLGVCEPCEGLRGV